MNSWTPLFSKIVDSSVWCESDHVRIVFITMLALKDSDHVVRYSAYQLGQRARKSEAEVLDALRVLSSPDTKRLEPQPYEGRRIEKTEDGWLVLNGQSYEDMMRNLNRRNYKTEKQREYRVRRKKGSDDFPGEHAYDRAINRGASPEELDHIVTEHLPDQLQETPPPFQTIKQKNL